MIKAGIVYRLISDHLGSLRQVVNTSTGAIAEQVEYDEFGNVLEDSNPGFVPFGFAGGLFDLATKLVRFGARDYEAMSGRWLVKDPIRFEGESNNLYSYVSFDPINSIDPNGKFGLAGVAANVAAGTAVGAAVGAGMSLVEQALSDVMSVGMAQMSIDWGEVGRAALWGGATGAVGGAATGIFKGLGFAAKLELHDAHHTFTFLGQNLGKWSHLQLTMWQKGIKNSHYILRMLLPWK